MLDLQEAHQKKAVGLANDQITNSWNFSFGSINFVQALGSLTAHVDPSIGDIPGVEWDDPQEVDEGGVPHPDEAVSRTRQINGLPMEHETEIVEVRR